MGIGPTYPAWKAGVLPLNYTCIAMKFSTAKMILHKTIHVVKNFFAIEENICFSYTEPVINPQYYGLRAYGISL